MLRIVFKFNDVVPAVVAAHQVGLRPAPHAPHVFHSEFRRRRARKRRVPRHFPEIQKRNRREAVGAGPRACPPTPEGLRRACPDAIGRWARRARELLPKAGHYPEMNRGKQAYPQRVRYFQQRVLQPGWRVCHVSAGAAQYAESARKSICFFPDSEIKRALLWAPEFVVAREK